MSHGTPTWQRVAQGRAEERRQGRSAELRVSHRGPPGRSKCKALGNLWECAGHSVLALPGLTLEIAILFSLLQLLRGEAALKGVLRFAGVAVAVTRLRVSVFLCAVPETALGSQ